MDYYPEYNTQQQEAPNVFRAFSFESNEIFFFVATSQQLPG